MRKNKKVLLVSALLIGLGGFYIYKNMKMKSPIADTTTEKDVEAKADYDKVLSKGSLGKEVEILQKALKGGLVVDGNFGALTEKRLKAVTGSTSITLNQYNQAIRSKSTQK